MRVTLVIGWRVGGEPSGVPAPGLPPFVGLAADAFCDSPLDAIPGLYLLAAAGDAAEGGADAVSAAGLLAGMTSVLAAVRHVWYME